MSLEDKNILIFHHSTACSKVVKYFPSEFYSQQQQREEKKKKTTTIENGKNICEHYERKPFDFFFICIHPRLSFHRKIFP
jgi:hypothetical protein